MKRTNFILNGFLALAIVLVFAQCSDKNNNAATSSCLLYTSDAADE